ncbi:MAG TPA: asparagine synthase-related protein [Candidatus Sulfotelmatobacter sp.]|nr:asparagine synthase-related protein [Candidatus Sulfotelmatobacter sp.]
MSVQFGRWNLDGKLIDRGYLEKVGATLAPYGPDGKSCYHNKDLSILYHAFHTTKESRNEVQPHICSSGLIITWDGRLDNRTELIRALGGFPTNARADVAIVGVAYERWGTKCFGKLVGDWAISICDPNKRALVLAKDPIGSRHLYYQFNDAEICWSTILDPLVRFAGKAFALEEEYIAGWLSMFPATHLTPYVGIHSVPASSFVSLGPGKHAISKYWDFDPNSKIRYKTDAEYEEHFRTVFATAVQRSLRSDRAVLAELSGGRDSSSIVCMADLLIARGSAETARLDTISYYDDSEPNWNERAYFTKVEEKRGRTGWHIDLGTEADEDVTWARSFRDRFVATPGYDGRSPVSVRACLASQGNLVVLSGIGGDETMGGVPTPLPELQDFLSRGLFGKLASQLKIWSLEKRKPWLHLFWDAARMFFPPSLAGISSQMRPVPWLNSNFVKDHRRAVTGYPSRRKLFGPLPSFQENVSTIDVVRRLLVRMALPFEPPFEKRYPYLDRGLLEFMIAIPREQLVRPAQRRSLMRRALLGIVPDEILNRKGKAFVARAPLVRISRDWATLVEVTPDLVTSSLGIVDAERFVAVLQQGRRGEEIPTVPLMRTLALEGWLRNLRNVRTINLDARLKLQLA